MKKTRLIREEVKDKHTSHWDMDMMSREELEAAMAKKPTKPVTTVKSTSANADKPKA